MIAVEGVAPAPAITHLGADRFPALCSERVNSFRGLARAVKGMQAA